MAKTILPSQLGTYITKLQGDAKDTEFASSVGTTRQTLRSLKLGEYLPNVKTLEKLGLELVYRTVDKPATDVSPVPPTVPAKAAKTAKK